MLTYQLYIYHGLTIRTDLVFEELTKAESKEYTIPDIEILQGSVSITHNEKTKYYPNGIIFSDDDCFLNLKDIAEISIQNGSRVTYELKSNANIRWLKHFLLGTAFDVLLHQRNILSLHASAVVINGFAVSFAGRSGIGKSTIATALNLRGYPLLADDTFTINFNQQVPYIVPSCTKVKLWGDSITKLNKLQSETKEWLDGYGTKMNGVKKYSMQRPQNQQPTIFKHIYFLRKSKNKEIKIRPLSKVQGLSRIMKSINRSELITPNQNLTSIIEQCTLLNTYVESKILIRPSLEFDIQKMVHAVEQDLN